MTWLTHRNKSTLLQLLAVTVASFGAVSCGGPKQAIEQAINPEVTKTDDPLISQWTRPSQPVSLAPRLRIYSDCREVEAFVEDRVIADMELRLERLEAGARGGVVAEPEVMQDTVTESASAPAEKSSAPGEFTGTNNQVKGVEEPDIVKTDGKTIFQVVGNRVEIVRSWPVESMERIATIEGEGTVAALILHEGRLAVIRHVFVEDGLVGGGEVFSDVILLDRAYPAYRNTELTIFDVSTPSSPELLSTKEIEGSYVSGRQIDGTLLLVLEGSMPTPPGVEPLAYGMDAAERKAKHDRNVEKVKEQDLSFWLSSGSGDERIATDCSHAHLPDVDAPMGITRVLSIPLNGQTIIESMLLAQVGETYASKDSLYLSTFHYWWDEQDRDADHTYIHKFNIEAPQDIFYQGSGGVDGRPLNQFAFDEYEGHLRVATTISKREKSDDDNWSQWTTVNRVTVLATTEEGLEIVGQTPDLAETERIFAARFYGPKGFLVTFRQVDPLFTLDLSRPEDPRVVGELKIPGFSNYMQRLGQDHLLAIGRDADVSTGRARELKLSIFDVSDMANPKEKFTYLIDNPFAHTQAQWDHKAFTFYASKGKLAIPVSGYQVLTNGWGSYQSELMIFDINLESGIAPAGSLKMKVEQQGGVNWGWSASVQRSIFADEFVYALSDHGVHAAEIEDLEKVTEVLYPTK